MTLAIASPVGTNSGVVAAAEPYKILMHLQPALTSGEARRMATVLTTEAKRCGVSWRILASIAYNESSLGRYRVNRKSHDYGLMQINIFNLKRFSVDPERLTHDDSTAVMLGCRILVENREKLAAKFPEWIGTYRSGPGIRRPGVRANAVAYDRIIRKTMKRIATYEQSQDHQQR